MLGFDDSIASADCVPVVLRHDPLTMESINVDLVERLPAEVRGAAIAAGLAAGRAWLLVEMGGDDPTSARLAAAKMLEELRDSGTSASASLVTDPRRRRCCGGAARTRRAWRPAGPTAPRRGAAGRMRRFHRSVWATTCAASTICWVGTDCPERLTATSARAACTCGSISICSVHAAWRHTGTFVEQATDLVVALGGSVSGEHGDGRARSELLGRMYGADGLRLLTEMKDIWDPGRVMNPGVIVDPPAFDAGDPACGCGQGPKTADALRLSGRQPRLRAGAATLCRHRQVQAVVRRRDVPELPGDARGACIPRAGGPTCSGRCWKATW